MQPVPLAIRKAFLVLVLAVALPAMADLTLSTPGLTWDPLAGVPASVPAVMRKQSYPPGTSGLWVTQYVDGADLNGRSLLVAATGFRQTDSYLHDWGYLWVGTPEQAAQVRALPFVRYVDYWYPFEKTDVYTPRADDPRRRLLVQYQSANIVSSEAAVLADFRSFGDVISSEGETGYVVIQAADWMRILSNPYIVFATPTGFAEPALYAVLPRSAPPGDHVVISGVSFVPTPTVTFRGVPSPHVTVVDPYRIDVEVPADLAAGPADIIVRLISGSNQIFIPSGSRGFYVGSARSRALERGDVVEGDYVPFCCFEGGLQRFGWSDSGGVARMISAEGPTAVAFDAHGRLLVASYTGVHWYEAALQPAGDGPPAARQATALVFDRNDNLIVVTNGSTRRLAPDGTLLGSLATGGTDADLAADNCTLYLGGPQIGRVNVCTMTALASIPHDAYGLRVLSDGSLLTVGGGYVRRLRSDGTLIAEQQIPLRSTSVALSADGSFAWLDGARRRYDFATNAASPYDESLGTGQAVSAAVYGGWTAARGVATYAFPGGDASPDVSATSVPVLSPLLLSALALALAAVAVRART